MTRKASILRQATVTATGLMALLLAACSADDRQSQPTVGRLPVQFTTTIGQAVTRSTLDNTWENNSQIYVCCTQADQADKKYVYTYNASTTAWSANSRSITDMYYWPISDPSWTFSAWPQSYGASPKTEMTVAANQTASNVTDPEYLAYDLLYAPPVAATYRQPVALNFLHQMARVVVIVNSSSTDNKETVTGITFGGGKVSLSGTITTQPTTSANATWTVNSSSQTQSVIMRDKSTKAEKDNNIYTSECILPPQSYTESSDIPLITITTTGDGSLPSTYIYKSDYTLLPGNQYTYSLSVKDGSKILISTLEVVPWATSPITGNGIYSDNDYPSTIVTE